MRNGEASHGGHGGHGGGLGVGGQSSFGNSGAPGRELGATGKHRTEVTEATEGVWESVAKVLSVTPGHQGGN
jgi:hypothetical protein